MKSANRKYCCVPGCLNSTESRPKLSFFSLPKNLERRSRWLHLILREDLLHKSYTVNITVCEQHFITKDIMLDARGKRLIPNALPALCLPISHQREEETQTTVLVHKNKHTQTESLNCMKRELWSPNLEESTQLKFPYTVENEEENNFPMEEEIEIPIEYIGSTDTVVNPLNIDIKNEPEDLDCSTLATPVRNKKIEDEDEFDMFGRYVANELMSMPFETANRCKQFFITFLNKQLLENSFTSKLGH